SGIDPPSALKPPSPGIRTIPARNSQSKTQGFPSGPFWLEGEVCMNFLQESLAPKGVFLSRPGPQLSRRREPRYAFPLPLIVSGFDVRWHIFREAASTTDLSWNGCSMRLKAKPQVGCVALRL